MALYNLIFQGEIIDGTSLEEDKYLGRKRPSFKTSPAGLNVFLFDLTQIAVLERTF